MAVGNVETYDRPATVEAVGDLEVMPRRLIDELALGYVAGCAGCGRRHRSARNRSTCFAAAGAGLTYPRRICSSPASRRRIGASASAERVLALEENLRSANDLGRPCNVSKQPIQRRDSCTLRTSRMSCISWRVTVEQWRLHELLGASSRLQLAAAVQRCRHSCRCGSRGALPQRGRPHERENESYCVSFGQLDTDKLLTAQRTKLRSKHR